MSIDVGQRDCKMADIIPLKKRPGRIGPRLLLFLIALLVLALAIVYWTPGTIQVVDGDTIRTKGSVYRLVGFDAPEISDAMCPQERAQGKRAAARLKMIVDRGNLELTEVRCSCPPETEGTQRCNYGRRCGILKANGEDVGQILIREGLARHYVCGSYSCPKRKPWCQGVA
jgi:endonuclease YncB( thermonuclease family)